MVSAESKMQQCANYEYCVYGLYAMLRLRIFLTGQGGSEPASATDFRCFLQSSKRWDIYHGINGEVAC